MADTDRVDDELEALDEAAKEPVEGDAASVEAADEPAAAKCAGCDHEGHCADAEGEETEETKAPAAPDTDEVE